MLRDHSSQVQSRIGTMQQRAPPVSSQRANGATRDATATAGPELLPASTVTCSSEINVSCTHGHVGRIQIAPEPIQQYMLTVGMSYACVFVHVTCIQGRKSAI